MSARLKERVALVTGGAMGMGAAHVRAFVAEGARVVVADVAEAEGSALAESLGDAATFVNLDVTDADQWARAISATLELFGRLNVLVNNAGIFTTGALGEYPVDVWNKTLAVNLTGAFLGMSSALPALKAAAPSSVINVSSTAGIEGYAGCVGYSASKWGLRGLTRSAALELAGEGVRVNSVHPGAIATPLLAGVRDFGEADLEGSSLNRLARPEEITGLVIYLASDESSFCTGAEFVIDGGITAGAVPR